jgi:hypothetical protein
VDHHWWQKLFKKQLLNDSGPEAVPEYICPDLFVESLFKRKTRGLPLPNFPAGGSSVNPDQYQDHQP